MHNYFYFFVGIRGGLMRASKIYSKANNDESPDYDETKDKYWLIYQDCKYLLLIIFCF